MDLTAPPDRALAAEFDCEAMTASDATRVAVRIGLPSEPLSGYVTFYYVVTASGPVSDFLYPEWGNVRFRIAGDMRAVWPGQYPPGPQFATLFGPTDHAAEVRSSGGRIAGFGLTPLGWHRLIGTPADALANRIRPLGKELGRTGAEWHASVVDRGSDDDAILGWFDCMLAERLDATEPPDAATLKLDAVLRTSPPDVSTFAERMAMSQRTLGRHCLKLFGFAPKRLLRRQRFLDALGQVRAHPDARFVELLDERYFDQSHFIRDFREFMGMTPRAYLAQARDIFHVAAAEQASRGITLSFRLPAQPTD